MMTTLSETKTPPQYIYILWHTVTKLRYFNLMNKKQKKIDLKLFKINKNT